MAKLESIIVVADDDMDDQLLIREALRDLRFSGHLHFVEDGAQLIEFLQGGCPMPVLVLLDLNMPTKDGRAALQEIKSHPKLRSIPVVMHSTSSSEEDIRFCYDHGVNTYVVKALSYEGLKENLKDLVTYWFKLAHLPSRI